MRTTSASATLADLSTTGILQLMSDTNLETMYDEIPVRDGLAAERTVMAAERTLLAYARTGLGLFAAGLAGAGWLGGPMVTAGWLLSAIGAGILLYGWTRYKKSIAAAGRMLKRLVDETRTAKG